MQQKHEHIHIYLLPCTEFGDFLNRHSIMGAVACHLAGAFVGSHLQADGGLVVGFVSLSLWIIQMSSGSIGSHSSLTCTLVCPHLKVKNQQ